jgi:hypothetical protein
LSCNSLKSQFISKYRIHIWRVIGELSAHVIRVNFSNIVSMNKNIQKKISIIFPRVVPFVRTVSNPRSPNWNYILFCFSNRAGERAWKERQFQGARTWQSRKQKRRTKEILLFWALNLQAKISGPKLSYLGKPTSGEGARKHWLHGALPGSLRPCFQISQWKFCTYENFNFGNMNNEHVNFSWVGVGSNCWFHKCYRRDISKIQVFQTCLLLKTSNLQLS